MTENVLTGLEIEGALIEAMSVDVISRIIIAEQHKIVRYALRIGLVEQRQLNEGLVADITLGLGQAIGSLPVFAQTGVGAAFGVAGVLWYGKEMLNSSGFDFAMNLIFCLFSAAAIEPTGVFGEAGALGKVIKPFLALGQWAKSLGKLTLQAAKGAYNGLSAASKLLVKGAMKAEGPIMRGLGWAGSKIMPRVTQIFESVKGLTAGKPGAELFTKIAQKVAAGASGAFTVVVDTFKALVNFGKTALGQAAAAETRVAATAAAETAATAKAGVTAAGSALQSSIAQGAANVERLMATAKGGALQKFADANARSASGVLKSIAAGNPEALKALAAATGKPVGVIPVYLQNSIKAMQGGYAARSAAEIASRAASRASATAGAKAAGAAQVAAARTAAAQTGAARVGASAVKDMFSSPEEEYAPQE